MVEFGVKDIKSFALDIYNRLDKDKELIFLCVGSDKFIADSLGPIVAEILIKKYNIYAYVYGGLNYNINASNLSFTMNYIDSQHPHGQIILVDATLSENIGKVIVTNGSFAGLGKILPIRKLGNFSILGVVGKKNKDFVLGATRLQVVKDLAVYIAKGIAMAVYARTTICGNTKTDKCKPFSPLKRNKN